MKRFINVEDRSQSTLFPECFDDYIADDNPKRVIDVFVDELNLDMLGFDGIQPEATGWWPTFEQNLPHETQRHSYLSVTRRNLSA